LNHQAELLVCSPPYFVGLVSAEWLGQEYFKMGNMFTLPPIKLKDLAKAIQKIQKGYSMKVITALYIDKNAVRLGETIPYSADPSEFDDEVLMDHPKHVKTSKQIEEGTPEPDSDMVVSKPGNKIKWLKSKVNYIG